MPGTKREKKKAKRKIKQKERRRKPGRTLLLDKIEFLVEEAYWAREEGQLGKALFHLKKALRLDPKNKECLREMGYLGNSMKRPDIEIDALLGLYNHGLIEPDQILYLCQLMQKSGKYRQALPIIQETLKNIPKIKAGNKEFIKAYLIDCQRYCRAQLEIEKERATAKPPAKNSRDKNGPKETGKAISDPDRTGAAEGHGKKHPYTDADTACEPMEGRAEN